MGNEQSSLELPSAPVLAAPSRVPRKHKLCEHDACNKRAAYGPSRAAARCKDHRLATDVDTRQKWCEEPGCTTVPSFGQPGGPAVRCGKHRLDGDQNLVSRRCASASCQAKSVFKRGYALHRNPETGAMDLCFPCYRQLVPSLPLSPSGQRKKRKRSEGVKPTLSGCSPTECSAPIIFGAPGGEPARCGNHRLDGDQDVSSKRCSSNYCLEQDLVDKGFASQTNPITGENDLCADCLTVLFPNSEPKRDKHCEASACQKLARYGVVRKAVRHGARRKAVRCRDHRLATDGDTRQKWCEKPGCTISPRFGKPGGLALRCGTHRLEGDQNIVNKRCSSQSCLFYEDVYSRGYATARNPNSGEIDLCTACLSALYPSGKISVRKEQFVLAEVQRCIPELEQYFVAWDCKLPLQSCNSDRPDMVWKIGETLLHVEVDENGNGHESNTERIVGIHAASGCKYHICIRFNPDRTASGRPPCLKRIKMRMGRDVYERDEYEWQQRIPILISEVKSAYRSCLEDGDNVKSGLRKLFF